MGRDALAAAVEAMMKQSGASRFTLWLPDYFCNEALDRVRSLPVELRFYPIDETLAPQWREVERALRSSENPAAFVLVHYFGVPNATEQALAFCKRHKMFLIEDAAHMLRPTPEIGKADALIYSPRKLLPVGQCAVLVLSEELHARLSPRDRAGAALETFGWMVKRLIQRFMVTARISWHRWRPDVARGDASGPSRRVPRAASRYAVSLLEYVMRRSEKIEAQRCSNYLRIAETTREIAGLSPLFPRLRDGICPYVIPIRVEDHDAQQLSATLRRAGIPAIQWPDLPPEVLANSAAHRNAVSLFDGVVLLPVHQTLTGRDLDAIGRCLKAAAKRSLAA
jgi:dTDP-4-amino-4,6-dideoxygalactose transaminase